MASQICMKQRPSTSPSTEVLAAWTSKPDVASSCGTQTQRDNSPISSQTRRPQLPPSRESRKNESSYRKSPGSRDVFFGAILQSGECRSRFERDSQVNGGAAEH